MGRNLTLVPCKELANLDKDADSRKSAMRSLESYVKEMDLKSIPLFLSQLFEIREAGSLSEEYTVSLYEVLAQAHGVNIVPYIDSIMESIVRTLASSGGSFPLQQSCSKVIPAMARYCINPIMLEDRKRHIIHSLCNPLCESLLGSQESLSSGAALCLKALVDSDNWKFASDEMVNKVSLNVAVALEVKSNQTNAHMGLVMALAKKNSLIVEAYARLLIGSGLRILNAGAKECNSQKRLSAIQMVNFLMKSLDSRSVYSELDLIIEEMEKYEFDQMAFVKGAAFEALQTARRILAEKECKSEMDSTPKAKSNFVNPQGRNFLGFGNHSPESNTPDSFTKSDSPLGLTNSSTEASSDLDSDNGIVKQRVQRFEVGVVDVSLKDGLFQELSRGNGSPLNGADSQSLTPSQGSQESQESGDDGGNGSEEYFAFVQESVSNLNLADPRSQTSSPQMSPSKFYIGNTHMFTASSNNDHSLKNTSRSNSESSMEEQKRNFTSSPSSKCDGSQTGSNCFDKFAADPDIEVRDKENGNVHAGIQQIQVGPESTDEKIKQRQGKKTWNGSFIVVCSILFLLLALIASFSWIDNAQEYGRAVPT